MPKDNTKVAPTRLDRMKKVRIYSPILGDKSVYLISYNDNGVVFKYDKDSEKVFIPYHNINLIEGM